MVPNVAIEKGDSTAPAAVVELVNVLPARAQDDEPHVMVDEVPDQTFLDGARSLQAWD